MLASFSCDHARPAPATGTFTLTSSAFADSAAVPARFTCDGVDVSPPLAWTGAPATTRSLALIVQDPDAPDPAHPTTIWTHWILYDLPPTTTALPLGIGTAGGTPGRDGRNDFRHAGWNGPCPPIGRHHYLFNLFALDTTFANLGEPDRARLQRAMTGHILARAQLVGTYRRPR